MKKLGQRLKDLVNPPPSEGDWCDTTRLAEPWSVLLGGRRRHERTESEPPAEQPTQDLRETEQAAGKDEGR